MKAVKISDLQKEFGMDYKTIKNRLETLTPVTLEPLTYPADPARQLVKDYIKARRAPDLTRYCYQAMIPDRFRVSTARVRLWLNSPTFPQNAGTFIASNNKPTQYYKTTDVDAWVTAHGDEFDVPRSAAQALIKGPRRDQSIREKGYISGEETASFLNVRSNVFYAVWRDVPDFPQPVSQGLYNYWLKDDLIKYMADMDGDNDPRSVFNDINYRKTQQPEINKTAQLSKWFLGGCRPKKPQTATA